LHRKGIGFSWVRTGEGSSPPDTSEKPSEKPRVFLELHLGRVMIVEIANKAGPGKRETISPKEESFISINPRGRP